MKKHSIGKVILLCILALLLAFAVWRVDGVGNHLQYLVKAPAPVADTADSSSSSGEAASKPMKPNRTIADWYDTLTDSADEWADTVDAWTMGGIIDQTSFTSDNDGVGQGRLTLLGPDAFIVTPKLVRYGRLFYPEELKNGAKVMLLDEQLALTLFRISDPIDRIVTVNDVKYTVVGVVRHTKQVGDYTDAGAYVPLMGVIDQALQLDAIQVEAIPIAGKGASVTVKSALSTWQLGGTFIDLGKEAMAAKLWLRLLLFLAAATAVLRFVRWLNHLTRYWYRHYRQQLQVRYAIRLMPEAVGAILLFALGYGAALALAAVAVNYIIEPVYTFPEWIPAVLVEWADIRTAFWKVWQTPATLMTLRTPELLRLQFFTLVIQLCSAGAGILSAMLYASIRGRGQSTAESLEALYREGVVVSTLRTTRPLVFSELGYLPCTTDEDGWDIPVEDGRKHRKPRRTQAMMRIINVSRILQQLPPTAKEGSFVMEVTDEQIASNNRRWLITCENGCKTIVEAERDWDLQMSATALTQLIYGTQDFHDFVENNVGFDLKMRSPAMDGLFEHHLSLTKHAS